MVERKEMIERKDMYAMVREAAQKIASVDQRMEKPEIGLILGSGLGVLAESLEQASRLSYEHIPHFPVSTVEGHAGEWVSGVIEGKRVAMMSGRFHLYEGYPVQTVTFPIRVMKELGIRTLIVTNAAGGVNTSFKPGDLMIIRDHINFMARNPLVGANDNRFGPRFPDMSEPYSIRLMAVAKDVAKSHNIAIQEGVYAGVLGPSYETPAEIRMLRTLGADAVGMSTVPETIAARHAGMEVLGISCITNMAAGVLDQPLSHDEVMDTAEKTKDTFLQLVRSIIREI